MGAAKRRGCFEQRKAAALAKEAAALAARKPLAAIAPDMHRSRSLLAMMLGIVAGTRESLYNKP